MVGVIREVIPMNLLAMKVEGEIVAAEGSLVKHPYVQLGGHAGLFCLDQDPK